MAAESRQPRDAGGTAARATAQHRLRGGWSGVRACVSGGGFSMRREAGNELQKKSWERSCGASGGGGRCVCAGRRRSGGCAGRHRAVIPRRFSPPGSWGQRGARVASWDRWSRFLVSCTHRVPPLLALRLAICRAFFRGCSLRGSASPKRGGGDSGEVLGIHVMGLQPSPSCVLVLFLLCGILQSSEDPHGVVFPGVLSPCIKLRRGICTCYSWVHLA